MNWLSRILLRRAAEPTALERLAADVARRAADMAQYRERRGAALPPSRKRHIQALLSGYVRPRQTKENLNV